jgi:hypothetical protein
MTSTIARSIALAALAAGAGWAQLTINTTTVPNGVVNVVYQNTTLQASGGTTPYTWTIVTGALPAGMTMSSGGAISGTPTVVGPFSFTAQVADSSVPTPLTATQAYSATIAGALTINTATVPNSVVNVAYPNTTLAAQGGTMPYTWTISAGALPTGMTMSSGGAISGTPTVSGSFSFTATVTDSTNPTNLTATQQYSFSILGITTAAVPNGAENVAYTNTSLAATGGIIPYTWTIGAGTLPAGMTLSPGGVMSGTPTSSGSFTFTAKVSDNSSPTPLSATQAYTFSVLGITTATVPNGVVNVAYTNISLAAQGGILPYTWTISTGALPTGMTLSSGGALGGTPTATGTFNFTAKVTDSSTPTPLATTQAYSFTIAAGLTITTLAVPNGAANVAYTTTNLQASGGTPPYTWAISTGSLPAGMTLSPGGALSGTPTASGGFNFTAKVTDNSSPTPMTATQQYSFSILGINTATVPNGAENVTYLNTNLAAQGGNPPYTWTISTGALPTGMTLSPGGALSGTPTASGTFNFIAKVTDSSTPTPLTTTQPYSFTILGITTAAVPNGVVNVAYPNTTLQATGGTAPYNWTISSGALPAGMTLSSGGALGGIPSVAGPFSFTAKVTDSSSPPLATTQAYSFGILGITTTTVPNGVVNVAYPSNTNLAATGGTTPYTWTISTGALPAGMTLSSGGVLSGTPTASGAFNFTAKVTDNSSPPLSTTQQYNFTVGTALNITTTSPLANGSVGVFYNQPLAGTGGAPGYTWTLASGSLPGGLTLTSSPTIGTIAGTPNATGAFPFTIRLSDSYNPPNTFTKQFAITISAGLTITTAQTLPNATVGVAYSQTLIAAGGATPYTWSITTGALPTTLSLNPSTGAITGTPTAAATVTFTATVTDSAGTSASQGFTLAIVTPPAITTPSPLPNGTPGVVYSQPLAATGGSPPYKWTVTSGNLPTGLSLSSTGTIAGTPSASGAYNFTVQLTDSAQVTASAAFKLTIITGLTISTSSPLPIGEVSAAYSQTLAAAGGTSPYTWSVTGGALPPGLTLAANGSLTGTPGTAGTYNFTVQATDSNRATATAQLAVTIVGAVGISTVAALTGGSVGANYSQNLAASAGVAPYTWTLVTGVVPLGLNLSAAGAITGTPINTGTFQFTAKVADSLGATASRQFTIVIAMGLTITSPATLPGATVGVTYSEPLQAASGTLPYTWSVSSGSPPSGLVLQTNGDLSGIPTTAGTFTFTVQVTDNLKNQASEQLSITIAPALSVTTSALPGGTVGATYSQSLAATGGTPPYKWSLAIGALPGGLTLSATGSIAGTAGAAGTFPFTVKVTDSAGVTATKQLSIAVAGGLSITTAATLPNASINASYSQSLAAAGGTPPYTWTVTAGALPTGLTLSSAGAITGTPIAAGTATFTATVNDSAAGSASQQFTLIVVAGLNITTTSLPGGKVGASYSQTLTATGGIPPYTFTTSAGSRPPGIALKGAVLSGTPTTPGSYAFTIQVTDSVSATATHPFTIAIGGLALTTSALAPGAVGTAYSQTLSASGTAPYTWAVTQGALPTGLSLDTSSGTISGTPTAAGTSSLTIQVTDSTKATASTAFTLTVVSASFTGLSSTAGAAQQLSASLAMGAAYPQDVTGQITLTFQPDASLASPADDPSIQFSAGGRTFPFTVAANGTAPVSFSLQTGTVAGTITLTVSWQAGGATLPSPAALTQTIQIAPAVPVISAVTAIATSSGFTVTITGYSNTREVQQALLQFIAASGQTLQTTSLTVPLTTAATTWFQNSSSDQYGSQFILTLPFTVSSGSASSIGSISVQLVNSQGTSTSSSATL